jgi:PAS domain S-box-containing protein
MPEKPTTPDDSESVFNDDTIAKSREVFYRIFEFAPDAILLVDHSGRIVKTNGQAERMFGFLRDELIGEKVEILIPRRLAERHIGYRSGYIASPHARPMGVGLDLFGRRKDDTEFPVDIMLSPLEFENGSLVLGVVRDATERKRIEGQAQEAREMYIREIHHRVKNNLQIVSSLLFLQSLHSTDPNIHEILTESQNRVKSIALIHEKLYRSAEMIRLDFAEYVGDLVLDLFRTYGVHQEGINVYTNIEDIHLEVDTAIPCGLIINELVSNVLKHAFPTGTAGEVSIALARTGPDALLLTVSDNGIGFPVGFNWHQSPSLGLKLVKDLARQLDGSVEVDSTSGTTFRITFKELQYKERS